MARMESDESNTKRVTVRVPESLVEKYEEALGDDTNRSEDIRQHMRETVSTPTTDDGLIPPQDDETLAAAYRELRGLSSGGSSIPLNEVRSVLASRLNVPKESISRRVLKPLNERNYIRRTGDPVNEPHISVRTASTDSTEPAADDIEDVSDRMDALTEAGEGLSQSAD